MCSLEHIAPLRQGDKQAPCLQTSCPAGAERSHLCAPCSRRLSPLYNHPAPLGQRDRIYVRRAPVDCHLSTNILPRWSREAGGCHLVSNTTSPHYSGLGSGSVPRRTYYSGLTRLH